MVSSVFEVQRVFKGSFIGFSRMFHGSFTEVSKVFQGRLEGVLREL